MRYLCPHHLKNLAADPVTAMTLWRGAMDNGTDAKARQDWQAARSFFGAAYETALLYNRQYGGDNEGTFSLTHLIAASRHLSDVLQQLNLWEEAQMCLLTLQNGLLQECTKSNADKHGPTQMLDKTQEVVDEMIALLDSNIANPKTTSDNESPPSPDMDVLLSSTLYLMTRYALGPNQDLAKAISNHLQRIENRDDSLSPVLQKTCRRLALQWQSLTAATNTHPLKSSMPSHLH